MVKEDYVSYEVAKLLKEKGFEGDTLMFIDKDNVKYDYTLSGFISDETISCPTHQMAMKWLRNTHGIHIQAWCPVVDIDTDILGVKYNVVISNLKDYCLAFATDIEDNNYDSYEEAVDAGLEYTLEHLI